MLNWINTASMKADGLTKVFNPTKHAHFARILGLTKISEGKKGCNSSGIQKQPDNSEPELVSTTP
jgi:hypothetical protein